MRVMVIGLMVAVWCMAGCGKEEEQSSNETASEKPVVEDPVPLPAEVEKLFSQLEGYRDAVCACTEKACVEALKDKKVVLSYTFKGWLRDDRASDEAKVASQERMKPIADKIGECEAKFQ